MVVVSTTKTLEKMGVILLGSYGLKVLIALVLCFVVQRMALNFDLILVIETLSEGNGRDRLLSWVSQER